MRNSPEEAAAASGLELVIEGRRMVLPHRPFVIGRGPQVDLDLPHPKVSRHHLVLEPGPSGWTLTDDSSNGTFFGADRVTQLRVTAPTTIRLGGADDGVVVHLLPTGQAPSPAGPGRQAQVRTGPAGQASAPAGPGRPTPQGRSGLAQQGQLSAVHQLSQTTLTIGRLPDNDVVVDDLLASRRHAVLRKADAGWTISDLNSGNGTFVNGRRITQCSVGANDVIGIGRSLLQLDGDRLVTLRRRRRQHVRSRRADGRSRARGSGCSTRSPSRCRPGPCSRSSGQAAPASRPC